MTRSSIPAAAAGVVTSIEPHSLPGNDPDRGAAPTSGAGAFRHVVFSSLQIPLERLRTSKPAVLLFRAYSCKVAVEIGAATVVRSERRYVRLTGDPLTHKELAVP